MICPLGSLGLLDAYSRFWSWPACPSQRTLPAQVTFQYQRLMAGTHQASAIEVEFKKYYAWMRYVCAWPS